MTPEQQRIAIAQACGWTSIGPCTCHDGQARGFEPIAGPHKKHLPDYPNDLNAMHEAEQSLWEKDWNKRWVFVDHLARIINPIHGYRMQDGIDLLDATAAQRAESFLKTLGLWKP